MILPNRFPPYLKFLSTNAIAFCTYGKHLRRPQILTGQGKSDTVSTTSNRKIPPRVRRFLSGIFFLLYKICCFFCDSEAVIRSLQGRTRLFFVKRDFGYRKTVYRGLPQTWTISMFCSDVPICWCAFALVKRNHLRKGNYTLVASKPVKSGGKPSENR